MVGLTIPNHKMNGCKIILVPGEGMQDSLLATDSTITLLNHAVFSFPLLISSQREIESYALEGLLQQEGQGWHWLSVFKGPGIYQHLFYTLVHTFHIWELPDLCSVAVDGHIPRGTCPYNMPLQWFSLCLPCTEQPWAVEQFSCLH